VNSKLQIKGGSVSSGQVAHATLDWRLRRRGIFIIALHIWGYSNLILPTSSALFEKNVYYLGKSIFFSGVNCYALITGYLCLDSRFRISRILNLWGMVLFYSLGFMLIYLVGGGRCLDFEDILTCTFPMTMVHYWYFTEYFRLFFLIPFLNYIVNKLSKKQLVLTMVCLLLFGMFMDSYIQYGYHVVWLAILYLFGAYTKRYPFRLNIAKKVFLFGVYIIVIAITYLQQLDVIECFKINLLEYTSPTIFISAFVLLIVFVQVRVPGRIRSLVSWMARRSFAVYLIHTHIVIWDLIIADSLASFNSQMIWVKILIGATVVVLIFLFGCVVDEGRERVWKRIRIYGLLNRLDKYLSDNVSEIPLFIKLKEVLDVKDGERHDME